MKIALIGYGRMGNEIHQIALARGHSVDLIIDQDNKESISGLVPNKIDVAIEFSLPSAAKDNIETCFRNGISVVSGTTGWTDKIEETNALCKTLQVGFLYASNFSLGMNIFFAVNKFLAKLMNNVEAYNVNISETHHTKKLDKPSGTSITLAEQILENMDRKNNWHLDQANENTIHIASLREGEVAGIHHVKYFSDFDEITLSHSAKSRKGFAYGALLAAEFLYRKKGVFTMKDVLNSILG